MTKRHPQAAEIMVRHDAGMISGDIAAEVHLAPRAVRHIIERELIARAAAAEPTRDELSASAQQKLDGALRRYQRELDQKFESEVRKRYVSDLNRVLPGFEKQQAYCEEIIKARKGVMPRELFRKILACLHPDQGMGKAALTEAFAAFEKLEGVLVSEAEKPTPMPGFPKSYAELMEQKRQVSAARAAARAGRTNVAHR